MLAVIICFAHAFARQMPLFRRPMLLMLLCRHAQALLLLLYVEQTRCRQLAADSRHY